MSRFPSRRNILRLRNDQGTGFTAQRPADIFRVGDDGSFAAAFQEAQDRLDLGQHAALGKMTFFHVFLGFSYSQFDPATSGRVC